MCNISPVEKVKEWLSEAEKLESDANAMSVASVDQEGVPSSRIVLLKAIDTGFVFYTNLESRKGREINMNPIVALCFHWKSTARQVRIEGKADLVSAEEADQYFRSRERESQIASWASAQSSSLKNREDLEDKVERYRSKFAGKLVSRPEHWSGFRVIPHAIEFWDKKPCRLHDRVLCRLDACGRWNCSLLNP